MFYLFLVACVVICLLVFVMFLILKKTVKTINTQTKLYFVDKLQEYDYLINEKEEKLNQIDKEIKEKESKKEENAPRRTISRHWESSSHSRPAAAASRQSVLPPARKASSLAHRGETAAKVSSSHLSACSSGGAHCSKRHKSLSSISSGERFSCRGGN